MTGAEAHWPSAKQSFPSGKPKKTRNKKKKKVFWNFVSVRPFGRRILVSREALKINSPCETGNVTIVTERGASFTFVPPFFDATNGEKLINTTMDKFL